MKHLKEANMSYWKHWWHATTCGVALIIHAWLPNVLKDYASNKICKKYNNERTKITQNNKRENQETISQ